MGPLLGKPKNKPPPPASRAVDITSKDRAMLDLKVARDKLKKYQKRVSNDIITQCNFHHAIRSLDQTHRLSAAG